jgi:hypothetical protein
VTRTLSRATFEQNYVLLHQARPQRFGCDKVVNLYVGRRPRRSLRARLGWIWSRFNAASWRDPFLMVVWIAVLLVGARMCGAI